jgi:hypothetical protein
MTQDLGKMDDSLCRLACPQREIVFEVGSTAGQSSQEWNDLGPESEGPSHVGGGKEELGGVCRLEPGVEVLARHGDGVLVGIDDTAGGQGAGQLRHGIGGPEIPREKKGDVGSAVGGESEMEHLRRWRRVIDHLDPHPLAAPLQAGHAEEGGKRRLPGTFDDYRELPARDRLPLQRVQRRDDFGRRFSGDDHNQVKGRRIRANHEPEGPLFLAVIHPFREWAGIVFHIRRQRRKDPMRKENPFHAGNLPEGAI